MKSHIYNAFCDTHMHLVEYGKFLSLVDLRYANSISELQKMLQDNTEDVIHAFGWNQEQMIEGRFPCAKDLDVISSQRPVLLSRICGHVTAVNTFVLDALQITKGNIPQIEGGTIDLDDDGNPTGIFRERARLLLKEKGYYNGDAQMVKEHILLAQEDLLAKGIVEVHSDDLTCYPNLAYSDILEVFVEMAQQKLLKIKVIQQAQGDPVALVAAQAAIEARLTENPQFAIGSLKLFVDGSLGARTAHLLAPYSDQPDTSGIPIQSDAALYESCEAAYRVGLPLTIHAIGDGAIHRVLSVFEKLRDLGATDSYLSQSGIIHCQIVNPQLLERMARLGIRAYIQPIFLHEDALMVHSRLGEQRASESYVFNTMHKMGIPLFMGSDAPIDTPDVIKGMHCARKRQTLHPNPVIYLPEEALALDVILEGYTRTSGPQKKVALKESLEVCIEKPHTNWVIGVLDTL